MRQRLVRLARALPVFDVEPRVSLWRKLRLSRKAGRARAATTLNEVALSYQRRGRELARSDVGLIVKQPVSTFNYVPDKQVRKQGSTDGVVRTHGDPQKGQFSSLCLQVEPFLLGESDDKGDQEKTQLIWARRTIGHSLWRPSSSSFSKAESDSRR